VRKWMNMLCWMQVHERNAFNALWQTCTLSSCCCCSLLFKSSLSASITASCCLTSSSRPSISQLEKKYYSGGRMGETAQMSAPQPRHVCNRHFRIGKCSAGYFKVC
jgi:hypothetical protein